MLRAFKTFSDFFTLHRLEEVVLQRFNMLESVPLPWQKSFFVNIGRLLPD